VFYLPVSWGFPVFQGLKLGQSVVNRKSRPLLEISPVEFLPIAHDQELRHFAVNFGFPMLARVQPVDDQVFEADDDAAQASFELDGFARGILAGELGSRSLNGHVQSLMDPIAALLDEAQLPQGRVESLAVDVGQVDVGREINLAGVIRKGQAPDEDRRRLAPVLQDAGDQTGHQHLAGEGSFGRADLRQDVFDIHGLMITTTDRGNKPGRGNLLPGFFIYTVVDEMSASSLLLAIQGQFGDNTLRAEYESFLAEALDMERTSREGPVWGTADKARLAELVERGRAGDLAAVESLYEMFKRPVFGLIYRHTQNQAVAEDLLQDVFLKIFTHFREVRDEGTFPGWVFRIALNTCYSYLRQKKAQGDKLVSLDDLGGNVEDRASEAVEKDLRGPLEQAIRTLAPRLRSVFVLHDVQGFKHEEIARTLGCAVGTSKSQLFKARIKVREYLRAKKAV
jgi:RNA polymerase sigma-70 factor (ECF subfamily)